MCAWRVTAEAGRFDEALDHFASRVSLTDEQRKIIPADARSRAFWIAGVAQLDIVQRVQERVSKAIADGTSLEHFKKAVRAELKTQTDAHIETVFRNATQTAYNAGRWHQMNEPSVLRFRPYFLYDAILDGRTTEICKVCGGTLLAASDPWWDTHWPPLHHKCRSSVRSLRKSEAEKRGLSSAPEADTNGFGLSPRLAKEWRPETGTRAPALLAELERKKVELDKRPPVPALPASFSPANDNAKRRKRPPLPELEPEVEFGGKLVKLDIRQQKAQQQNAYLRKWHEHRQGADQQERHDWLLWDWQFRGSAERTGVLMQQAALREFGLKGAVWDFGIEQTYQASDMTRTQRDLRALHDETQKWFKARGIRSVTLYRGISGHFDDAQNVIESWTADKAVAERFAREAVNGRVIEVTVPATQILSHSKVGHWVNGPYGEEAEHLVMW